MRPRPESLWESTSPIAVLGRTVLAPLAWVWGGAMRIRRRLHETGVLPVQRSAIPVVSVGNLSVGGTGKTPVASWLAGELARRGHRPAIVLRGYGGDEAAVHAVLTPGALVVVDADRVRGVAHAHAQGATIAILDDGFQHQRAARDLDLVLISADAGWHERCLPAGPLRETPGALARADLVIVTRKEASEEVARGLEGRARSAGARQVMHLRIASGDLRQVVPDPAVSLPLDALRGVRVLAVSGIGNPSAFERALAGAGAVVDALRYADHHAYAAADVSGLVGRATDTAFVVCTLKDAVKLRDLWPRSGPVLWYVSQRVVPEAGEALLQGALDGLGAERTSTLR